MNEFYVLPEDEPRGEIYQRMLCLIGRNRRARESILAAVGLFGGLLSIILGVAAWAAFGLLAPAGALGSFLDIAGTVLLVLPLPLLALGAHCLDLLEKKSATLPLPVESHTGTPHPALRPHRAARISRHALNMIFMSFGLLLPSVLPAPVRARQTIFNVPSSDVLDSGVSVITAVNIQHIESLNDAVARTTGVSVRETIPDSVRETVPDTSSGGPTSRPSSPRR